MKYIYIALIIIGLNIDIIDFGIRFYKWIKRKKVPSPGMFVGFAFMGVGLHNLIILSKPITEFLNPLRWIMFLVLLLCALFLHLFIHIVLFHVLAAPFNMYYGRRLFDCSLLPSKKSNQ